jgi:1-acyl-sn-glycerol-3-phosphate acyltransferase
MSADAGSDRPPASDGGAAGTAVAPPTWEEVRFYDRVWVVGSRMCRLFWGLKVIHPERVPATGPCVLAPCHRSLLDTPFLGCVTRRRVRFMGKAELWDNYLLGKFLTAMGGFPVDRGAPDRVALRAAQTVLERGEPLGMFPEGTRMSGPEVAELHYGVAFLAARSGVPIVPIGIGGSEKVMGKGRKIPGRGRIVMIIGEPIYPPSRPPGARVRRGDVVALTAQLQVAIQELFDEAQAATLAKPGRRRRPRRQ